MAIVKDCLATTIAGNLAVVLGGCSYAQTVHPDDDHPNDDRAVGEKCQHARPPRQLIDGLSTSPDTSDCGSDDQTLIVVTALSCDTPHGHAAAGFSVLADEEIKDRGISDPSVLTEMLPSVNFVNGGGKQHAVNLHWAEVASQHLNDVKSAALSCFRAALMVSEQKFPETVPC